MSTVQVGRAALTSPYGTAYIDPNASPYTPAQAMVCAPYLNEYLEVQPQTGQFQPGGRPVFEFPTEVDLVQRLALHVEVDRMDPTAGTATFARLVDFFGLALIDEIRLRFGTERLITIRREEIFVKIHKMFDDEDRNKARSLLGGALTPAERSNRGSSGSQIFNIPLYVLLGLHFGADPSQSIATRAMGERFRLELDCAAASTLAESDGTWGFANSGDPPAQPPAASEWFRAASMLVEGIHVTKQERQKMEMIYQKPRRYLFRDYQHVQPFVVPSTQALNGATLEFNIRDINQPVVGIMILCRWQSDLNRADGGAGGTRGRNWFNVGGWFNPGGATDATGLPVISHVQGRVGSSAEWLRTVEVDRLLNYEKARTLKGSGLENGDPAVMYYSFSHDPSLENAVLGYTDFSQMDNATLRLTFNTQNSLATINDAALQDIGVGSALEVLVIGDTFNQLNFSKSLVGRPFN
jgi:hypothetical protein